MSTYTLRKIDCIYEHTLVLKYIGSVSFECRQLDDFSIEMIITIYNTLGNIIYTLYDSIDATELCEEPDITYCDWFQYYYKQYKTLKTELQGNE
jgi:hypothetical protein